MTTTDPATRVHVTSHAPPAGRALPQLAGCTVLVLNRRDVAHPLAGGAETYAHEISQRWVQAGVEVTWMTARDAGQSASDEIDGVRILRAGSAPSVYGRTALRLLRSRFASRGFDHDAVVDCRNGIPSFSPVFTRAVVPVMRVVHHVNPDQLALRSSPAGVAAARLVGGKAAERAHRGRRTVAVSASMRQELRRRARLDGVIDVVPHGCCSVTSGPDRDRPRAEDPTIVLTTRLVPDERVDLLLHAVYAALPDVPDLQVHVIGAGEQLTDLRRTSVELGLGRVVHFHGRLPDAERDALMDSAWLTTSTSEGKGWGVGVLEAAAGGVPCLALRAPGISDAVVHGVTGWLVEGVDDMAATLATRVGELADPVRAREVTRACRRWAGCFTWDRSAELLAGVVLSEMRAQARTGAEDGDLPPGDRSVLERAETRRHARSDMTTLARFTHAHPEDAAAKLRLTDEVAIHGDELTVLLRGCNEVDAMAVLGRVDAQDVRVRLASRHELLGGPAVVTAGLITPTTPVDPAAR